MIHDELTQQAQNTIIRAVRTTLGLQHTVASLAIVAELDKSGYGNSFGHCARFVLTSKAIDEIVQILETNFFN